MTREKFSVPKKARFSIIYRIATPAASSLAREIHQFLSSMGHVCKTGPAQRPIAGIDSINTLEEFTKSHVVIVLGGDGTYLRAIKLLRGADVPLLGVNLGSLGFLTPVRASEAIATLQLVLNGHLVVSPRSMLSVSVWNGKKCKLVRRALNDAVLERGSFSQLIDIDLFVDSDFVKKVKADGLVIATPTGSTAYSLAAGGPILHPETNSTVVSPVAPHSLTSRPLIFPNSLPLKLKMVRRLHSLAMKSKALPDQPVHLVIDGELVSEVSAADEIRITQAKIGHRMLLNADYNYFGLLREKFKFGDRE